MRYLLLFLLSTLGLVPLVQAGKSDVEMTGIASYSELRRPYYIGALYLDQPVVSAGQVLSSWGVRRMEMRITAQRWTPRRFSSQWTQALILNVDPARLAKYDDAFVQFNNLPRAALRYGDHIVVESDKKGRTRVSVNGTEMFSESRPGFFEILLATWIGDKPPSTKFKQAVLGSIDQDLLREYEVLQPVPRRKAEVAAWPGGEPLEDESEAEVVAEEQAAQEQPAVVAAEPAKPAAEKKEQSVTAAVAAVSATVAASATAAAPAQKQVAAIADSVAVTDAVPEPKVAEPVNKPAPKVQQVAMAPTASRAAAPVEEPEIDPAIYRLQQDTLLKLYRSSIIKRALRQVKYPKSAVRRGQQGVVELELTVDRKGNIVSLDQAQASRFKSLNSAAVAAVHDAGRLPPVPAGLEGEQIVVAIPVKFTLQ